MKPLRLRDTALTTLIRYLLRLRFCTSLTLCYTLFQRLALLSDTSLVQSAFGRAFSLRSPLRARDILSSPSFPLGGALALFAWRHFISRLAAERICRIDALSPHYLAPFVGGISMQSVTATLRGGRNIGTRECRNVKPLRLHDTALAALLRCLLQLRCCTPLPLCNTLFQRLSLLSDTSLCPNLICEILRLLAPLTRCEQASLLH